jgi:hypothetical protein
MKIKDIRREVLRKYRNDLPRGDTDLADKLERSLSQINQIIGPNPTRGIGDALAADIETKLGKPSGWLDRLEEPVPTANHIQPYKPDPKNDAMLKTLLLCYNGLSDAHKDVLAMLANKLYVIDNPSASGPSVAQPFFAKRKTDQASDQTSKQ